MIGLCNIIYGFSSSRKGNHLFLLMSDAWLFFGLVTSCVASLVFSATSKTDETEKQKSEYFLIAFDFLGLLLSMR